MSAGPGPGGGVLRVGLDVTALASGNTGVAEYARRHLANLRRRSDVSVSSFALGRGPTVPGPTRHIRVPLRAVHAAWRIAHAPRAETLLGDVDVVHSIDMVPPPTRRPLVMTVHDSLPLSHPELYGPRYVRIATQARAAAARAAVIVTTCEATADELARHGYSPRERIVVAPLGRRAGGVDGPPVVTPPYLLAVGSITPRKAFHVAAAAVADLGRDAPPLVIAGPDGWRSEEVLESIAQLGIGDRVRILGRVDDETLDRLLHHATALCHPSVAEGFGIPCLEAMGVGVPVVAADIPPVRELTQGVAWLVPPGDPAAFASALRAVLADPAGARRRVEAGVARATPFTWERTTDLIVDAYRRAAEV